MLKMEMMKMDTGKYRGQLLAELPIDYLEWALVHISISDEMRCGLQAELSRRLNQARVEAETPAERVLHRAVRPISRGIARLHQQLAAWRHGSNR